ncbi:MmpS family protein [Micromonospora sp. PLK6-60]|uniref:MmpS family transport accessory protein n=1 Tax=Micromonospora sp. PLK6-60 TaxID=2873383 RepID=UPI001CA6180E|nr:MmpS family transport accessory protein [Micromonospora sp. PLK6-60]MBY8874096.1 MmpS family protein [Micromonospora sp. PLK6-60]
MSDPTPPPSRRGPAEDPRDPWADLGGRLSEHPFGTPRRPSARRALRGLAALVAAAVVLATVLHRQGVWTTPEPDRTAPAAQSASPRPGDLTGVLTPTPNESAGAHRVVYEVTGDGPVSVTYWVEGRAPETVEAGRLPWRAELRAAPGTTVNLLASRQRGNGGIQCRLLVDGVERARNSAAGAVPVADCSARVAGGAASVG